LNEPWLEIHTRDDSVIRNEMQVICNRFSIMNHNGPLTTDNGLA